MVDTKYVCRCCTIPGIAPIFLYRCCNTLTYTRAVGIEIMYEMTYERVLFLFFLAIISKDIRTRRLLFCVIKVVHLLLKMRQNVIVCPFLLVAT